MSIVKETNLRAYAVIAVISVSVFTSVNAFADNQQVINGQAGGGADYEAVHGDIEVPAPDVGTGSWHKDYMVYVTDPWDEVTAGSGLYLYKSSSGSSVNKCHLELYANEGNDPGINYHYIDCSPVASGTVTAEIIQTQDDGKTWKGDSAGNTQSFTFSRDGAKNPAYFGYVAGTTKDDDELYSHANDLQVKQWGIPAKDFSDSDFEHKCYESTGYKFEYVAPDNDNDDVKTGPPTAADECTIDKQDYGPYGGEWR